AVDGDVLDAEALGQGGGPTGQAAGEVAGGVAPQEGLEGGVGGGGGAAPLALWAVGGRGPPGPAPRGGDPAPARSPGPRAGGGGDGGGEGDEEQGERGGGGGARRAGVREVEEVGAEAEVGSHRRVPAGVVGRGHTTRPALTDSPPPRQTA